MRNIVISLAAVAALSAIAAPAAAQQQNMLASAQDQGGSSAAAPARQQPRARANDDRLVCMSVQLSGSRMRREVCRTEREWQARGELDTE